MLTPDSLRDHYGLGEFVPYTDDHLQKALDRAFGTVGRYLPRHPMAGTVAAASVDSVVLTLARAYAHDELQYQDDHPVVRELKEALHWLDRVGRGEIPLFDEEAPLALRPYGASSTVAPPEVFTTSFFDQWPS